MSNRANGTSLILFEDGKVKHWDAHYSGGNLIQTTWVDDGKRKETKRPYTPKEGALELDKLERRRFASGYVRLQAFEEVEPGEIFFECYGPVLHDMSSDGRWLALARYGPGQGSWCRIEIVDTTTGARRVAWELLDTKYAFIHSMAFDASNEFLFVLFKTTTFKLNLQTGEQMRLAEYGDFWTSHFNPYNLPLSQDASRSRIVICDAEQKIRVWEGSQVVLEVDATSSTTECRGAKISPSGRYLALFRGTLTAMPDVTPLPNVVEIWDIATGQIQTKISASEPLGKIGFDPQEKHLLVTFGYYGPAAFLLASGEMVWRFGDEKNNPADVCYGWSFSPDGSILAVGRYSEILLYNPADQQRVESPSLGAHKAERIFFSNDGQRIAAELGLNIAVRKTPKGE